MVQQPQVPHLIALLLACAQAPPPSAPLLPEEHQLLLSQDRDQLNLAAGDAELAAALTGCASAGPCRAERWGHPKRRLLLLRDGPRVRGQGWPDGLSRWPAMGQPLLACLPDPLASPAHRRLLHDGQGGWTWMLRLEGDNHCALSGQLQLDAHRDRVDARGLQAAGLPWASGGLQEARRLALIELKAQAEQLRPLAEDEEREKLDAALDLAGKR
jgi:hypothetical protein